jgi:hypothetical protein
MLVQNTVLAEAVFKAAITAPIYCWPFTMKRATITPKASSTFQCKILVQIEVPVLLPSQYWGVLSCISGGLSKMLRKKANRIEVSWFSVHLNASSLGLFGFFHLLKLYI